MNTSIGKFAQECWQDIPRQYSFVKLDKFMVMPNHIHGIIVIDHNVCNIGRDAINRVSTSLKTNHPNNPGGITKTYNPMLHPGSLSTIIRWFKGQTTFKINNKIKKNIHFQWQT